MAKSWGVLALVRRLLRALRLAKKPAAEKPAQQSAERPAVQLYAGRLGKEAAEKPAAQQRAELPAKEAPVLLPAIKPTEAIIPVVEKKLGLKVGVKQLGPKVGVKRAAKKMRKAPVELPISVKKEVHKKKRPKRKGARPKRRKLGTGAVRKRIVRVKSAAALKGWETRRKKLNERMRQLEKVAREIGKAKKEVEALKKEIATAKEDEMRMLEREVERRYSAGLIEKEVMEKIAAMPLAAVIGAGHYEGVERAQDIDSEIKSVRRRMHELEVEYYKRKISADEFRKRLFDYRHQLRELEEKKKALGKPVQVQAPSQRGAAVVVGSGAAAQGTQLRVGGVVVGVRDEAAVQQRVGGVIGAAEQRSRAAAGARAAGMVGGQPQARLAAKTDIGRILAEKAAGQIDSAELKRLEGKMLEVMARHNIEMREVEARVRSLGSERLLENFSRLIELLEPKGRAETGPKIKPAPIETVAPAEVLRAKPKLEVIATGLRKKRIVTDFDSVLAKVSERGEARFGQLAKELNLGKKELDEVLEVLEDRGLVVLKYPAIGEATVYSPGYVKQEKQKKQPKQAKGNSG